MDILYYLPDAETLKKIKFLAALPGLYDIEISDSLTKDYYIRKCFYEVEVGMSLVRPQKINNFIQAQQK